jgi:GTP-binding protein EngB required for normal cell division
MNDFNVSEQLLEDQELESVRPDIVNWLNISPGEFSIRDIDYDLNIKSKEEKRLRLIVLEDMIKENKLERVGSKRGHYRPYQMDLVPMRIGKVDSQYIRFWLPFKLHKYVGIMPGNVIIIAGAPNAGKTALIMNIIKNNRNYFNRIDYFNSEAGEEELNLRLSKFDGLATSDWAEKVNAWERAENFADVITPGKGNLNVIDFLECHDEFYKMGQYIKEIHAKLKGAVAVIGIQKNANQDNGLGGFRSMEKARLAISMDNGKMKITKAKNFITDFNPNGLSADFKLVNGCKFVAQAEEGKIWYK